LSDVPIGIAASRIEFLARGRDRGARQAVVGRVQISATPSVGGRSPAKWSSPKSKPIVWKRGQLADDNRASRPQRLRHATRGGQIQCGDSVSLGNVARSTNSTR